MKHHLPLFTLIIALSLMSACTQTSSTLLQSYESPEYGFSFKYPEAWGVKPDETVLVAIELPKETYPNTNFGEATFSISAKPSESLEACLAETPQLESTEAFDQTHFEVVNGVTYYLASGSGAAAGNLYDLKYDRTYKDGTCFEILQNLHTTNIGNYDPGTVTEVNETEVWQRLDDVFQTLTF